MSATCSNKNTNFPCGHPLMALSGKICHPQGGLRGRIGEDSDVISFARVRTGALAGENDQLDAGWTILRLVQQAAGIADVKNCRHALGPETFISAPRRRSVNKTSYLVLGVGLFTETAFALAQTPRSMLLAQVTGAVPPSGVLQTPLPAPVPPSGTLATIDRQSVITVPSTTEQKFRIGKNVSPLEVRRRSVHRTSGTHRPAPTSSTTVESVNASRVVKEPGEVMPREGMGDAFFLSQFGKGKE
jgi:hypothetical protein